MVFQLLNKLDERSSLCDSYIAGPGALTEVIGLVTDAPAAEYVRLVLLARLILSGVYQLTEGTLEVTIDPDEIVESGTFVKAGV